MSALGNLKFDVTPAPDKLALGRAWREVLGGRPVWLAASTREGEEVLVLEAWREVSATGALLVLVPRHPQRFAEVAALLEQSDIDFVRRSEGLPGSTTQVWLGDSMGEMAAYYAGAARRVGDPAGLAAAITQALLDPGELAEMRAAAAVFAAAHRGATERTVGLIRSVLTVQRQGREGR